jgi:mannose-6-phosphate isomerase-like protein (cupin superfamily)
MEGAAPTEAYNFFDLAEIKSRFPATAESMIVDAYLSDHNSASARLFRLYHPLPRHYHLTCDEHLVLLEGEVDFTIADQPPKRLCAGQMVTFLRKTEHAVMPVPGAPAVFLALDTPRRLPDDVHFTDPAGKPSRAFVTHLQDYGSKL